MAFMLLSQLFLHMSLIQTLAYIQSCFASKPLKISTDSYYAASATPSYVWYICNISDPNYSFFPLSTPSHCVECYLLALSLVSGLTLDSRMSKNNITLQYSRELACFCLPSYSPAITKRRTWFYVDGKRYMEQRPSLTHRHMSSSCQSQHGIDFIK